MSPMACGESGKNGTFNSFSSTLTRQSSANTLLKSNASMSGASSNARDENDVDDLFTSKPNFEEEPQSKGSFVGTEDYIAPEIIRSEESTFASDLWSLGVIAFQLFTGKTPFKSNTAYTTFEKIQACDYEMPNESKIPIQAQDLIRRLLNLIPAQRLGAGELNSDNDMNALKAHPYFLDVNFTTLHLQNAPIVCTTIRSSIRPI